MRRVVVAFIVLACFVVFDGVPSVDVAAAVDQNAYFNNLISRPDHWKSFSLRSQQQLDQVKASSSQPPAVNYLYPNDPDPRKQDAAKVVIPPFVSSATLAALVSATDTTVQLAAGGQQYVKNRQIKVDSEIMTIVTVSGATLTVTRGTFGTGIVQHKLGAQVWLSTNSLQNQVWLPLGTTDGHSYLATWDAWYGSESRKNTSGLNNWKTFQFDAPKKLGGPTGIWYEIRTRFDLAPSTSDVAKVDARGYSSPLGPNVTSDQPLSPAVGTFVVRPETWTRYWALIEQRAKDWDLVSLWVADEYTDPVQIIDRLQFEAYNGISQFRLEYNTSQDPLGANRGPLVSYVRNFVALMDTVNPTSVMERPYTGKVLPPRNFRIVQ